MGRYTQKNLEVLSKAFVSSSSYSDEAILGFLQEEAKSIVNIISQNIVPIETGNLADSFGVGIYKDGVLVALESPNPRFLTSSSTASAPKLFKYKGQRSYVNGRNIISKYLNNVHTGDKYYFVAHFDAIWGYFVDQSLGAGGSNKQGKGWWSQNIYPKIKSDFEKNWRIFVQSHNNS